jgi:hypothetical protein
MSSDKAETYQQWRNKTENRFTEMQYLKNLKFDFPILQKMTTAQLKQEYKRSNLKKSHRIMSRQ